MNTDLMKMSFIDCISRQKCYPEFFIVEHFKETGEDFNISNIVLHEADDLQTILKYPIIGFRFLSIYTKIRTKLETCKDFVELSIFDRPIVYDESLIIEVPDDSGLNEDGTLKGTIYEN